MSTDKEESVNRGMQYPTYRVSKKQEKWYKGMALVRELKKERREIINNIRGKEVFKKNGWL